MKKNPRQKFLVSVLCLSMSAAPLVSWSSFAQANNTINILPANQPQVMILLDNSQGMAGVLQGPTGLSGAIMTGSGTVPENANSSSPVNYTASGFTPPALGSKGASVPYSVPCNTSGITAAAQSACVSVGAATPAIPPTSTSLGSPYTGSSSAYIDNSQSMLNVAEQAIGTIINTPEYSNNIQFGLMNYALSGNVSLYNTWVYYMSGNNTDFSFHNTTSNLPSGYKSTPNPCYQSGSTSCQYIQGNYGPGYGTLSKPLLFIKETSDNPIINDVLYSTNYLGNNFVADPFGNNLNYNLSGYKNQTLLTVYTYNTSPYIGNTWSVFPTSAGYNPQSLAVWYSQRGYAFNASTAYNQGNIVSPISATNSINATNIANAILPEVFRTDNPINYAKKGPITASAGYSPMAGAFSTALSYFGKTPNDGGPPHTCGSQYVIFITDGQPTQGTGGNVYPPLGSASAQMFYPPSTSITASNAGSSTSDPNNAVVEAIQEIQALAQQGIKTYVLGVGSAVNPNVQGASVADQAVALQGQAVLTAMAQAGGTTNFYAATSASGVQSAMNSIIANILGKSVSASYGAPPSATVGLWSFCLRC